MIWAILTGLLIYLLIGFLVINWAVGSFTLTASHSWELPLLLAFWLLEIRGLLVLRILRLGMQKEIAALEAWAKSGEKEGDEDGRDH